MTCGSDEGSLTSNFAGRAGDDTFLLTRKPGEITIVNVRNKTVGTYTYDNDTLVFQGVDKFLKH